MARDLTWERFSMSDGSVPHGASLTLEGVAVAPSLSVLRIGKENAPWGVTQRGVLALSETLV